MLFAAAREDHVRCTIEPALAAGKWVVCDRFADSTRVYQGALGQVDRRLIKGLERVSIGDLLPDLTLILDVPGGRGAGAPGAAPRRRSRPTGSKRRTSNFTKSCARRSARSPPTSRSAASSSMPACRGCRSPKIFGTPCRPSSTRPPRRSPSMSRRRKTWCREARIMSPQASEDAEAPHPRTTAVLFGHASAEAALLAAYRSGRIPHAFLIAGPQGHRQGDARLPLGALRAGASRPGGARGRSGNVARPRSVASGGAPDRGAGPGRPPHPRAHAQRKGRLAPAHRGR